MKKLPSLGVLVVVVLILGSFLPPVQNSSISNKGRSRRQVAFALPSSTITPQPKTDCDALEELKDKCKICPTDDKTLEKCCNCLQTCCVSVDSESGTMGGKNMTESNSTTPTNTSTSSPGSEAKSKLSEAAGKVGGFFKNVGESIKHGVDSGWDKVKTTANTVKESVRKGVNSGADWVRNKTTGGDGHGHETKRNGTNCTKGNLAKDPNCTDMDDLDMRDGDIESNSTANMSMTMTEKPSSSNKTKRSTEDDSSSSHSQNKNKIKITVSTNSTSPNTNNKKDKDVDDMDSSEENDPKRKGTSSKLRSSSEEMDNKDNPSSSGSSINTSNSNYNTNGNNNGTTTSSTTRKPVPGMHKSRKRRHNHHAQGSFHYQNGSDVNMTMGSHPPWSSSGPGYPVGSYSTNTTTITSSGSVTSMGDQRNRRDVPPGMMAERSRLRKAEELEEERKRNETVMMMTNGTTNGDGNGQRSRRAPVGDENDLTTMRPANMSGIMNDKDGSSSSSSSKSKRSPAGPPSNSQSMRTTTAEPGYTKPSNDNSYSKSSNSERRRRRASSSSKTTTESPVTIITMTSSTMDPLGGGGNETNSSMPGSGATSNEDFATKPPITSGKGTKVWITVSSSSSAKTPSDPSNQTVTVVKGVVLVPIRAPGSIPIPEDISHKRHKKGSSPSSLLLQPTSSDNSSDGAPEIPPIPLPPTKTVPASDGIPSKPGRCRPLSQGLQCVPLGRDSAQCKADIDCEGSKKCCFYSCAPNSDIGICELPIFS